MNELLGLWPTADNHMACGCNANELHVVGLLIAERTNNNICINHVVVLEQASNV